MRVKGWSKRTSEFPRKQLATIKRRPPPPPPPPSYIPRFHSHRKNHLTTTTLHLLQPLDSDADSPCIIAIVKSNSNSTLHLYHPLTDKPHRHLSNLPKNFDLSRFDPTTLDVSLYSTSPYNKLWGFPAPKSENPNYAECNLLGLFNGGDIWRCPPSQMDNNWVKLLRGGGGDDVKFDDIAVFKRKVYVVDNKGKVCEVNISNYHQFTLGKTLVNSLGLVELGPDDYWRKRLVVDGNVLYLVVRTGEEFFKVFMREGDIWGEVEGYDGDHGEQVLFIARDYYFFMEAAEEFPGTEYKDCIVFSEGAFPEYGKRGWLYENEDDIGVFRFSDETFERECDDGVFPRIDWSPPDWVFSEREEDKEKRSVINIESDSDSQDQDNEMQCDSDSEEKDNEDMHTNANMESVASLQEDASPSLFGSGSGFGSESESESESESIHTLTISLSVAEEVTKTLLRLNGGGNDATVEGTSRKSIPLSGPRACTSSTTKSYKSDYATTRFEGFDIRSDVVPTLQKIWQKHGNLIEKSTVRSGDIVARALESLATMVLILEDHSARSLSGSHADYLRSTLSDLKCICFKVHWLVPFVEKAVKLHKRKPLLDSLNNLSQLSSQVKERTAIISDELAKLSDEENKLKEEIAKVSKMIPFSGKVKFDEPLGLGLT